MYLNEGIYAPLHGTVACVEEKMSHPSPAQQVAVSSSLKQANDMMDTSSAADGVSGGGTANGDISASTIKMTKILSCEIKVCSWIFLFVPVFLKLTQQW